MHRHSRIRALVAVSAASLALGGLAVLPAQATAHAAAPTAARATSSDQAAVWLAGQLTDGVIHNDQYDFDDIGLTIDTGLAADAIGEAGAVSTIANGVAGQVAGYVGDGTTESYAGALGKAATFAEIAGRDPRAFGGVDLIGRLEARVTGSGAAAGRIVDQSQYGDYANVIGQAFAVQALSGASSASAASALAFLLKQQCDAGYFRLNFSAAGAAAQDCDGSAAADAKPSVDATATVLRVLLSLDTFDDAVNASIDAAIVWLEKQQYADGSFGSDDQIVTENANSTGLAGWALGLAQERKPARRAAEWLRAHQVANAGACVSYATADTGAIAYDDAALADLAGKKITAETQDQFRRATAQALPALQYARPRGDIVAPFTAEYVKAGTQQIIVVRNAAPGELVCLSTQDGSDAVARRANKIGGAKAGFKLPKTTGRTVILVSTVDGLADKVTIKALGETTFEVTAKRTVARGGLQSVVVSGLAPAETLGLSVGGRLVKSGQANAKGVYRTTYRVTGAPGRTRLLVTGAFSGRQGTATYTVTR